MDKFFKPNSIAIIGASIKPEKVGGIILRNLLDLGYKGKIFPVNPKYEQIGQLKCCKIISEIRQEVDLAVIAIPAEAAVAAVRQAAEKNNPIKNFVIISAGFGEIGADGIDREKALMELAAKYNLKIIGPNCLGIINTGHKMNLSFSKNNFYMGKVGLITQSGALTTALFDLSSNENIGFSLVATMGNKTQLNEVDFLRYFMEDTKTEVIGMYLEDIKHGHEFCQILRQVTKIKPVVVLKAGSSVKIQAAILSHTGAMAGEAAVAKEAIRQSGGIYTDDFLEFIEIIKILNGFKAPLNNQIVIATNAGGPGVLTVDLIEKDERLKLFEFSHEQKQTLKLALPSSSSVSNPIDLLGDAGQNRYGQVFDILSEIKGIGAVISVVTPQAGTDIAGIAKVLLKANNDCNFPVLPVVMGGSADCEARQVFGQSGMANFVYSREAVMALGNYIEMLNRKRTAVTAKDQIINLDRQEKAKLIWRKARQELRNGFYFEEADELAGLYDFNVVKYYYLNKPHGFDLKFPAVIKVDSPEILHKDRESGVALGINSAEEAHHCYREFEFKFPGQKILIQEQATSGVELILGIKQDANFGTVIMLGLGGLAAEALKTRIFWLLPVDQNLAEQKIKNSVIGQIIDKQKLNLTEIAEQVVKLADLANENKWIKEMDINPIICYRDKLAVSVDIKILIQEARNN